MSASLPEWFRTRLENVTRKRARTVVEHISRHGSITTEELTTIYNYQHPPRAIQDVKDCGIPLKKENLKTPGGKTIARYTFDASLFVAERSGRSPVSKQFKKELEAIHGTRCAICLKGFDIRALQVDHRVPYEVAGDQIAEGVRNPDDYMLVCPSCNSGKRKSCEGCPNGTKDKVIETCKTCFWAYPRSYLHIATLPIRQANITWSGAEVREYDALVREISDHEELPDRLKQILREHVLKSRPPRKPKGK